MTPELTNLGRQTLLKAMSNETELVFSSMSIGDGVQQNPLTAIALKNAKISSIPFTKIEAGKNFVTLSASISNYGLETGFRIKEFGFFVKDPNNTDKEILYAIGSEDLQTADYIPSKNERLVDLQFDVSMYIGTAENVSATLAEAIGYNPGVGKSLAGEMVAPGGESVTAGDGAEIFNDYRERTQDGLSRVGNVASGDFSHAEGEGTTASGKRSHSEGTQTLATGNNSHAEGGAVLASGTAAHAEGMLTQAVGVCSHAEGYGTHSTGDYSHAENDETTALGNCSHAEGVSSNSASYDYTQDTANSTITTDWANKKFSLAKGKASHVEGDDCLALGDNSHAEGKQTEATGTNTHSEGESTLARGENSHAEGFGAQATGDYSHAEGVGTLASGACSHSAGFYTEARRYQTVCGKFNAPYGGSTSEDDQSATATIFIVGNGTSTATSNAFRITADGQCRGVKSFAAQGADFAEYFEWLDGNPNGEDRRGKIVTLDGEKIKLANDGDYILGIVTGSGAFIGNGQSENWQGKYLKDVFGDWLTQTVEVPETTDEKSGEVIPAHTVTQLAVNPDYEPTTNYVAREFRKEWSPVGMLGQVTLIDDGTCTVNGYCKPGANGIGTASDSGYRVLKRIDDTHVKVLVK